MAGTPWSDLSETGDSYFTNRYADPIIYPGVLSVAVAQYAGGLDVRDPRLSPVYGDFTGFPPTLLLAGTRDIFLSNTVRVDRKLRDAGRRSELIVYEGQSHAAYLIGPEIPETKTALDDIAAFFTRELRSGGSPGRGRASDPGGSTVALPETPEDGAPGSVGDVFLRLAQRGGSSHLRRLAHRTIANRSRGFQVAQTDGF